MDTRTPAAFRTGFKPARADRGAFSRALAWLGGFFATGAALAIGAVLAVFAAAAVAVIALFGGMLVFLSTLAFRARRVVVARDPGVIEARKVGHSWVAYGWDSRGR
ncbi:MAG TPA: hypothetical protein VD929_06960 [Caulobacteraceae bacterium]|nr:hypothetical protein [Caulobacteraceae bacterium]